MTNYSMYLFNETEWGKFRAKHPELRFWQALRAYLHVDRIEVVYGEEEEMVREDTFYWQDDHDKAETPTRRTR